MWHRCSTSANAGPPSGPNDIPKLLCGGLAVGDDEGTDALRSRFRRKQRRSKFVPGMSVTEMVPSNDLLSTRMGWGSFGMGGRHVGPLCRSAPVRWTVPVHRPQSDGRYNAFKASWHLHATTWISGHISM
jgi:hypothetical protein